jgi:hypothetical protein
VLKNEILEIKDQELILFPLSYYLPLVDIPQILSLEPIIFLEINTFYRKNGNLKLIFIIPSKWSSLRFSK